jgi:anti-sigma regulatory factor (Ser/Thr protein kinase)
VADKDEVKLVVPASPEFVRLARVTASGLANRLGFSYDEIEDLRLAVDELCHAVIGPSGRAGIVTLRYLMEDGGLCVEGHGHFDPGGPPVALSGLAHQILSALADEHDVREDDGQPTVWFRKQAREGRRNNGNGPHGD